MMVSLPWITHLLFIALRLSVLIFFSPIQAVRQLSAHTRLLMLFSFSSLLLSQLPIHPIEDALILRCLSEFSIGLFLAISLQATFSIYQLAGQLIDNQIGLNTIAIFKPDEPGQETLSAQVLSLLAVLCFLGSNSPLCFFKSLYYSLILIPPGTVFFLHGPLPLIKQFGFMFSMAFLMASPLIIALVVFDLCSALISRSMPQVPIYFFTIPLKIILGLLLLMQLLPYITTLTDNLMTQCFQFWQASLS